jgi:Cu(I)/Ag(I) efflux system membrane protein CusA/SilA
MIAALIRWSVKNRFFVVVGALALLAIGVAALRSTSVDALPDLSDVQVIIRTPYPGQAPQIVENQVTYPLATTMLSVPGAKTVRGYSFFGDSFVYVLFEDGTGPFARPGISEPGAEPPTGDRQAGVGARRHRRRLGL